MVQGVGKVGKVERAEGVAVFMGKGVSWAQVFYLWHILRHYMWLHLQFLDKASNFSILAAFPFCLLFSFFPACAQILSKASSPRL